MIRALEKNDFGPNMYGTQIHKQKYIVIINNKHQCIEYVSPMQHNYLICIILGFLIKMVAQYCEGFCSKNRVSLQGTVEDFTSICFMIMPILDCIGNKN